MSIWFKVSINNTIGFMLVTDGYFVNYYNESGEVITPNPDTSVIPLENDVVGPF